MPRKVTAIYRTYATADLVSQDLEQLGIAHRHITLVPETMTVPDTTDPSNSTTTRTDVDGAFDQLHDLDLPEEDTRTYQQAVRNGDYVVSVSVDDDTDLSRIQGVMRRPEDAYDLDEMDTQYSTAEYMPRQPAAGLGAGSAGGRRSSDEDTVEVVEEELSVGKRKVEGGTVRVNSYMREVPVEADVDLRSTRVYIDRRPMDRAANLADLAGGDQVLEADETIEEPVVSKQARVVEEIGLRQETEVEHQRVQDTVRKTEVEIEDTRTGERTGLTGDQTGRNRS